MSFKRGMVLIVALVCGCMLLPGCPLPETGTGACCTGEDSCTVMAEAACAVSGGAYRGDGTDCTDLEICLEELTIFSYAGGECPEELTVKDGSSDNVECGVPRSRLFDENSPLDGSDADSADGGFGTFPGVDSAEDTGILVRLDGFAADPADPRANIVIICLNIIIPPHPGSYRAVKCRVKRAAGFELTPEAQAVVNSGKRNYWAQQARKLAKLEADAAGGVDPGAARRADRLRRRFDRKNNTDYDVLADGTRYMEEMEEETETIEIDPPTPGAILTLYLVFVGDAFSSLSEFIPELDIMLARDPQTGSPSLGSIDDNALVIESVDELGPATVVDYVAGAFDPQRVDLTDPANANAENAIWITNSSDVDLSLTAPGHPDLILPPDQQVAFNDLADAGSIASTDGSGAAATLYLGDPIPLVCCVSGECLDTIATEEECLEAGGSPVLSATCDEDPCAEVPDLGIWGDTLGDYVLAGSCPGDSETVSLILVNGLLTLRGLPENEDIALLCDAEAATADGVTAFGQGGHELTITEVSGGLQMSLFQPESLGSCESLMQPR